MNRAGPDLLERVLDADSHEMRLTSTAAWTS
jgi:hypothetical protein